MIDEQESLIGWGFSDSGLRLREDNSVEFSGTREVLAGKRLPNFLPWVSNALGVEIDCRDTAAPRYPPLVPDSRIAERFLRDLSNDFTRDQLSDDPLVRLRHGHGHSQAEIYAI